MKMKKAAAIVFAVLMAIMCYGAAANEFTAPRIDAGCMFDEDAGFIRAGIVNITGSAAPDSEGSLRVLSVLGAQIAAYEFITDADGLFCVELAKPLSSFCSIELSVDGSETVSYRVFGRNRFGIGRVEREPLTVNGASVTSDGVYELVLPADANGEQTVITGTRDEGAAIITTLEGAEITCDSDKWELRAYFETDTQFSVGYADGSEIIDICIVIKPADHQFGVDGATEGDVSITGHADDGADVKLFRSGILEHTLTVQSGSYKFELGEPVRIDDVYEVIAEFADGSCSELVPVVVVDGSAYANEINVECIVDKDTRSVEIYVKADGMPVPVAVYMDGELVVCDTAQDGFTAVVENAAEGGHTVHAEYDGYYAAHAGADASFTVDTEAPVISTLPAELVDTDNVISVYLNEPAFITLRVGDTELRSNEMCQEYKFDVQGILESGTRVVVNAEDNAGNITERQIGTVRKAQRAELQLLSPENNGPFDAFEKIQLNGAVYVIDEAAVLDIYAGGNKIASGMTALPGGDGAQKISAEAVIPFDIALDAEKLPVGQFTDVEFVVTINGEEYEAECELSILVEKSRKQLAVRVMTLAGLTAVLVLLMTAYIRTGRKMAALDGRRK